MRKTNVRRVTHAPRVMQAAPYPPKIPCPRPVISPGSATATPTATKAKRDARRTPSCRASTASGLVCAMAPGIRNFVRCPRQRRHNLPSL